MNVAYARTPSFFERVIEWREKHISQKQLILILSFLVGVFTAVAALILKQLIHWIEYFLIDRFDATASNFLFLIYPAIGIFLVGLFIRKVVRDDIGHGITKILYAISQKQAQIKPHNMWSSIIACSITIGFGGSVGAEAPIVLTGSAIGSNLGRLFKLDHKTLMLMVGCGAAGAIAAIFKAPITGLVFVLEVLMLDLTMYSLLPLLVSSVTAACCSYIFFGMEPMFLFHLDSPFTIERVPTSILLGIYCGLIALYFTRAMNSFENVFRKLANRPYLKFLLGASVLSVLIYLLPSLFGEGYNVIDILLNGKDQSGWDAVMSTSLFYGHSNLLVFYLILVLLMKVFATTATNGGGGCGGTFAPSLFVGSVGGFVFARLWNQYGMGIYIPEKNYAMLGMAGVMSAVMHAPLTGVFLIAELTGGYSLFVPLLIVSISAYLTIIIFEPHSIYAMRLAKKGELLTHHKDKAILTLMNLGDVIDKSYDKVAPDTDLGELTRVISRSHHSTFPVVDGAGKLLGIITLDDIRNIMFRIELYHRFQASGVMKPPAAQLSTKDSMDIVMAKFDATGSNSLPVTDNDDKYVGFVSKAHVFNLYRKVLVDFSAE